MIRNTTDWRSLWSEADPDDNARDLVTEFRNVDDYAGEPADTLNVAAGLAEASQVLHTVLAHDWALYTPQQAAAVASSAFAQAENAAQTLRALVTAMNTMAARGDVAKPGDGRTNAPGLVGLAGAVARLHAAADELAHVVEQNAPMVTESLKATPCTAPPLPANVHEATVAVAELLGDDAHFKECTEADHTPEGEDGFGCGCSVDLVHAGERWSFYRGDSSWLLVRESDGQELEDGGVFYSTWKDLRASRETADPRQLVELIHEELACAAKA